jgi:MarR-like DNA-binding transcriptional regulator SgrR of sgrS sRNA
MDRELHNRNMDLGRLTWAFFMRQGLRFLMGITVKASNTFLLGHLADCQSHDVSRSYLISVKLYPAIAHSCLND